MSKDNYITNKKLTGGMDMSKGISHQDLVSIKYIFENMDKGLKYIVFEGTDDFALYYSDGHTVKCQCKIKTLTMKYVASLCAGYGDNDERVIIGSGMDDEFRNFYQKLVRYRNARIEANDPQKLDKDFQEFCIQKKIDAKKLQNIYFDSVDSISAFDLAKYAIIDYGNRKHIYVDENEIILKLGGMIGFDLRPHANSLSYDQIKALVMKNRVKKSIGMFESDPMFSDYIKNKIICELLHMESKHIRYRAELAVIRNSIELNQYAQAKNEVLDVLKEEEWICPVYCWLLNRLNDDREMEEFVNDYRGSNPQILFEKAKYYYLKKEYNDALKILKSFPEENKTPELFMLWALVCANIQENNEAIKNIKKCIELDSSFVDAYILWASLIKKEDAKEAVDLLNEAKKLDVKNPNIYYELSSISEMKDDFLLSAKYLKKYIRLSGDESIKTMIKLPVFLNYVDNKKWKKEYFEMIRKIQNNPPKENINIPILIMPKHMEHAAVYIFHYEEGKNYMEKNGSIISDIIDSEYDFGIGKFASETNNQLVKFVGSNFANPARMADDFIEPEAFAPIICCFPKSYEAYNKILQEVLRTKSFRLNHEYSEHSNEYLDYKGAINLIVEEKDGRIYGVLRITDELRYNFIIDNISDGYKGFCEAIKENPFREAIFLIAMNDKVHQTFFTFTTDQIEIKSRM